jgi:uncharacterized protein YqhQ
MSPIPAAVRCALIYPLWALAAAEGEAGRPEGEKKIPVGGQAVIEGVLMKGPARWGLSIREPEGGLFVRSFADSGWIRRGVWKWPVLRGVAVMAEMLRVGMKALSLSAQVSLGEEQPLHPWETALTVLVAILGVVGLFVLLPVWLADRGAEAAALGTVGKNALEGLARGAVFVLYVAAIGLMPDMRRVFAYHGAEHKTINAYESGDPLTPEAVALRSRIHARCGTSFLLIVVAVSILVFGLADGGDLLRRIVARVLLLPLVVGISYEIIRGASNAGAFGRWIISPALWLQKLTTREPDGEQLEVAIRALEEALDDRGSEPVAVL